MQDRLLSYRNLIVAINSSVGSRFPYYRYQSFDNVKWGSYYLIFQFES